MQLVSSAPEKLMSVPKVRTSQSNKPSEERKGAETMARVIEERVHSTNGSASSVVDAWKSFQPQVPFSYLVASRKAARLKNS